MSRWKASRYRYRTGHVYVPKLGWVIRGEDADTAFFRYLEKKRRRSVNDLRMRVMADLYGPQAGSTTAIAGLSQLVSSTHTYKGAAHV